MTDSDLELIANYRIWAKIVNCTKVQIQDPSGDTKDLLVFLT